MKVLLFFTLLACTHGQTQRTTVDDQGDCTVIHYHNNYGPPGDALPKERGVAGPPGKRGPQGQRGPRGEKGSVGEKGLVGQKGEIGIGIQGEAGRKGDTGLKGEIGSPGPRLEISEEQRQHLFNKFLSEMANLPKSCAFVNSTLPGYYWIKPMGVPLYAYCSEERPTLHPKTCNEINHIYAINNNIYPRGPTEAPLAVQCNFESYRAITSIGHDSLNEIKGSDCEPGGCYTRHVTYQATMEQMVAIIEASTHCRQYIKYRCIGSMLLHGTIGWWIARDGTKMLYWGGATSHRNNYCACGETGTCHNTAYTCNCDANVDDKELSDEGYLDDKNKLPVISMSFGDMTASSEHGWHTLGPLECWG